MENKFSKYLKKKKPILTEFLAILLEKYEYANILATDVKSYNYLVDKQTTTISESGESECGYVIKVYANKMYYELSTNNLEKKNFNEILEDIASLTTSKMLTPQVSLDKIVDENMTKSFKRLHKGKKYTTEEIVSQLKEIVKSGMEEENVVNARVRYEEFEVSKLFLSKEKDLEQYYNWINGNAFVLVRKDNNMKYNYTSCGGNSSSEVFKQLPVILHKCSVVANALLNSKMPEPGIYDVITDPSITGLIAHEAFGHGVEMDQFVKDRALAKEYIGKRVASPLVDMYDGALATNSVASYFFDDEGVLGQNTKIIDKGILLTGICDSTSALELNTKATGNGRRENYKHKAYTRMTNTIFAGGNNKLEKMIASIKHGFLISTTSNGMEDPKNWGIQCAALYGQEIVDGKLTSNYISPVVISGYVIDLLESISQISPKVEVSGAGHCGKGYKEWVRVSDGGAYMKAKVKIG